ncbi:hypothetical protein D3C73_1116550 [compost metagenome]
MESRLADPAGLSLIGERNLDLQLALQILVPSLPLAPVGIIEPEIPFPVKVLPGITDELRPRIILDIVLGCHCTKHSFNNNNFVLIQ